jgi:RimJ/RimL family protein N-acetyltransferase
MLLIRADQVRALHRATRERLARGTVDELYHSSPHAMLGLSAAEIESRLQTALAKADRYSLYTLRDLKAFVQLCYRVGPNFDEYSPFQSILTSRSSSPLDTLFDRATDEDWNAAAVCDIVGRSLDATEPAGRECASPTFSRAEGAALTLVELTTKNAAVYHQQALHPDVWRLAGLEPLVRVADVERCIRMMQADPDQEGLAIIHTREGFVGAITLRHDGPTAQLLYWVGRRFWGKGVATAAVRQRIAMLQGHPMIRQVTAEVFAANAPSLRVLEKCGFARAPEEAEQGARRYRFHIGAAAVTGR